jgi:hypothetical protein
MAVSSIAQPVYFSPAYNPLKFIFDSTNKNEAGFRYVFDIYESGTTNKLAEYRVLPRIGDGYGELDIAKLMQGFVDYDLNLSATEDATAPNSFYKYDLKVGEELVTEVDWTADLTQNGTYTTITATHAFIVGDRVVVDGGIANPNLSGLYTVTAINTTVDFTINALWTQVDDATGNGSVRYSDNRKTITRDLATANNQYVYNAAFRHLDWIGYSEAPYILSSSSDKFLTSIPTSNFYITPTQELYFNLCTNSVTTGRIYFENDLGDKGYYVANASGFVFQANVGSTAVPSTVTNGTLPIIKDTATYYDVWYTDNTNAQLSAKYRIYLDHRCAIEDYQILFVDRLGSINSFAFQLRAYESGTIQRDTYNQDIQGGVTSTVWGYTSTEFGQKTFSVSADRSLQLNTNWMTEEMAEYFEELLTSPLTILKSGAVYQPVIVTDSSYEIERQRNNNLIKKTITVKFANQDIING